MSAPERSQGARRERARTGACAGGLSEAGRGARPRLAGSARCRRAAATSPPEARGLPRDGVRMLVASASEGLTHRRAYHLPAGCAPATCW